jgi:hypothetical protein
VKHEEALLLTKDIAATERHRVKTEIALVATRGDQRYYAVDLLLVPGQRIARVRVVNEWPPLRQCWSLF